MFLEVENIDVRYGTIRAISGLSLDLGEGEIVAILGANGAGKSSLLRTVLGVVKPACGRLRFAGVTLDGLSPAARVRLGLSLVPEGRQVLVTLSVEENLLMGAYSRRDHAAVRAEIASIYERFPNLAARRHMKAAVLSGGEQQMLAIGRALLSRPRVLMLDEPSLGLSPKLVDKLFDLIADLNRAGMSILLVEQNTRKALELAKRAYVLELGRLAASGTPAMIAGESTLLDAYLGQA